MRWRWSLLLALAFVADAGAALRLGIHADEPAPTIANLLARRLPDSLRVEVTVFQDARATAAALRDGDLDLAFVEEPIDPLEGAEVVSAIYPSALHILFPAASPATSLVDILSAPAIWAGAVGGIGQSLARGLAGDYDVGRVELLPDPWSREPQVYFMFGGLLERDALSRLEGYRLYSLDEVAQIGLGSVAEGIALRYANLRPFVLPAQLYPGLSDQPALTLTVNTLLVATAGLSDGQGYELAMVVDRLRPEIASVYPLAGLAEFSPSQDISRALPLHAGAQRYADREQPGLIERYAEFVGATVTVGIGVITLCVALYRRRRQARKDRLDSYYLQALQWRSVLSSQQQAPAKVATEVHSLQEEVFGLLIAERIDADTALLAFMNLTNQLLREAAAAGGIQ